MLEQTSKIERQILEKMSEANHNRQRGTVTEQRIDGVIHGLLIALDIVRSARDEEQD